MSGKTDGQAACEAFWAAIGAGPEGQPEGAAWRWAKSQMATEAWEAAAAAGSAAVTAERDRLRELLNEASIAEPPDDPEAAIVGAGTEHLAAELAERKAGA